MAEAADQLLDRLSYLAGQLTASQEEIRENIEELLEFIRYERASWRIEGSVIVPGDQNMRLVGPFENDVDAVAFAQEFGPGEGGDIRWIIPPSAWIQEVT